MLLMDGGAGSCEGAEEEAVALCDGPSLSRALMRRIGQNIRFPDDRALEITMAITPTQQLIDDIRRGRMIVLADAEDRENEGDLVLAADFVTPEAINFLATHARGLVCLTLTEERCRQLALPLMVNDNRSPMGTAFTVSIEAASGVSTGISAADRARTVRAATARHAKPEDVVQPGHIFPVMAQPGGVLVRAGHTEAGCDLGARRAHPRGGHLRDHECRRIHGAHARAPRVREEP